MQSSISSGFGDENNVSRSQAKQVDENNVSRSQAKQVKVDAGRFFALEPKISGANDEIVFSKKENKYYDGVTAAINESGLSLAQRFEILAEVAVESSRKVAASTLAYAKGLRTVMLDVVARTSYLFLKAGAILEAVSLVTNNFFKLGLAALAFQGFKKAKTVDPEMMDNEAKSLAKRSYANFENTTFISSVALSLQRVATIFANGTSLLGAANFIAKTAIGPVGSFVAATAAILPNISNKVLRNIGRSLGLMSNEEYDRREYEAGFEEKLSEVEMVQIGGAAAAAAVNYVFPLGAVTAPILFAAGTNGAEFAYKQYLKYGSEDDKPSTSASLSHIQQSQQQKGFGLAQSQQQKGFGLAQSQQQDGFSFEQEGFGLGQNQQQDGFEQEDFILEHETSNSNRTTRRLSFGKE